MRWKGGGGRYMKLLIYDESVRTVYSGIEKGKSFFSYYAESKEIVQICNLPTAG